MKKWFLEKWSVGYACHSIQADNGCRIPVVEEALLEIKQKEIDYLNSRLKIAEEAIDEIACLALGGLDMSTTKFNAYTATAALKIANKALWELHKLENK